MTAPAPSIARRSFIGGIAGSFATAMLPEQPLAETGFYQWIAVFRSKAIARGIADDTYTRVMEGLRPDTTGLEAIRNQAVSPPAVFPAQGRNFAGRRRSGSETSRPVA